MTNKTKKPILMQIHHEFADRTEMIEQYEFQSDIDTSRRIEKLKISNPLPVAAHWVICNEESGFFVTTKEKKKQAADLHR